MSKEQQADVIAGKVLWLLVVAIVIELVLGGLALKGWLSFPLVITYCILQFVIVIIQVHQWSQDYWALLEEVELEDTEVVTIDKKVVKPRRPLPLKYIRVRGIRLHKLENRKVLQKGIK